MSIIRVKHDSRRIVIPILLLAPFPPNNLSGIETTALLDTGATTSGITPRIVKQLELEDRGKRPLGSARGESQVERHLFRVGFKSAGEDNENSFPYIFESVMGFALTDSFQLDALIGMDILSQCDFHMQKSGDCTLRFG